MSDQVVVLRQGDPVVVLREQQAPLIIEREVPTSISVERFGTTIESYDEGVAAQWGGIRGDINNQADLQAQFASERNDIIDGGNF